MSYSDVRKALTEVLKDVEPRIPVLLAYEPTELHDFPTLYTLFDAADRKTDAPGRIAVTYRITARLAFRWQDNEQAELETEPYVSSVPALIDANPTLNGLIGNATVGGWAKVIGIRGGYVKVGGVVYRVLDFQVEILEKVTR